MLCTTGIGFCNYDEFNSPDDRGQYNWTEQIVSPDPQLLNCFYEPQDAVDGGMAERICEANLLWADYNGLECITLSTFILRKLARELAEVKLTAERAEEV